VTNVFITWKINYKWRVCNVHRGVPELKSSLQ